MFWLHSHAVSDVIAERCRQVSGERWSAAHDDEHAGGEMARAGAAYGVLGALKDAERANLIPSTAYGIVRDIWPATWGLTWLKPKDRRRDLVRGAALLIAEIERIDRLEGRT